MTLLKFLLKYFGFFLIIYFALTGLSYLPAVKKTVAPVGIAYTEGIMATFYPKAYANVKSSTALPLDPYHLIVSFQNNQIVEQIIKEAREKRAPSVNLNTKFFDFFIGIKLLFPLIFLFSLVLITPTSWRRKLGGGTFAFMLVLTFITMGLCFVISHNIASTQIGIYEASENALSWYKKLGTIVNPMTDMTFVLLTWLLVFFKKEDFRKLVEGMGSIEPPKTVKE